MKVAESVIQYCRLLDTVSYDDPSYLKRLHLALTDLYAELLDLSTAPEPQSTCDAYEVFVRGDMTETEGRELCERVDAILDRHGYFVTKCVHYRPDDEDLEPLPRFMEDDLREIYGYLHSGAKMWSTANDDERNAILNYWQGCFGHIGMNILYAIVGCHNMVFSGPPKKPAGENNKAGADDGK